MKTRSRFVEIPHLPHTDVTAVVVSGDAPDVTAALRQRGIQCLHPESCNTIPPPTACHADMIALHLGGGEIALAAGQGGLKKALLQRGFFVTHEQKLDTPYPADCGLNILLLGGCAFLHKSLVDAEIARTLQKRGYKLIAVNQGYARCATAVVARNAVITADACIQRAVTQQGIDCLRIPAGEILLNGYAYGFIGGCCGKLSDKLLAFTGDIGNVTFGGDVRAFCRKYGVDVVSLAGGPLVDIGGIVPVCECRRENQEATSVHAE